MTRYALLLLAVPAGMAFAQIEHKQHEHKQHEHKQHHGHAHGAPAAVQGVTSLDVYADGATLHVLTGEQRNEQTILWHRRSVDAGATWSVPARIAGALPRPLRRGDDAQVAARGDTVLALYSVPGTGWGGSGPLAGARSTDGGRTWAPAVAPSDSGLAKGEGFADLRADASGFHAVWLDSRDGRQGLRHAVSADGRRWSANVTIAAKTCECCWNTLEFADGALHVLYRAGHPRDMALATFDGKAWSLRGAVASFGWHVKGCPETGGALARTADGVLHALAWTGKEEALGLHVLARRGGAWSAPRRIGGADAKHGDLAASGARLLAAWNESEGIHVSQSEDGGRTWSTPLPVTGNTKLNAFNPRVAAAGSKFLVAWTEDGPEGRVLRLLRHP